MISAMNLALTLVALSPRCQFHEGVKIDLEKLRGAVIAWRSL
jgi:hypothetical protein